MYDSGEQILGNYRLIRLLERGGFAEVYLGEHIHLNTQAAIKVLHSPVTEEAQTSFLEEAQIIARLEHPHIVHILDFGVQNQLPFLVMSYAPNGTLRQRHQQGSHLPFPLVVTYLKQIAAALQYAHDHNVIHRDVKPQNLLIGLNDEVLLSDFGLALIDHAISSPSLENQAGTIIYMAPEQFQGKAYPASDQYALGVVIYEWLCGVPPFQGTDNEIAMQHQFAPPPSLHQKISAISLALEQVMLKALAKDPKERFANVQEFAMTFEQVWQSSSRAVIWKTARLPKFHRLPSRPSQLKITNLRSFLSPVLARVMIGFLLLIIGSAGMLYFTLYNYRTSIRPIPISNEVTAGLDAQHTNFNPYERLLNTSNISHLTLDWTTSTGNIINYSPSVANGIIYVGSGDGKLFALDASTGQLRWNANIGAIVSSIPVVASGIVYLDAYNGKVFAVDASTGQLRWSAAIGDGPVSDLIIASGIVYLDAYNGKVFAVDASTGQLLWSTVVGDGSASGPVAVNGVIYIASRNGKLFAFDAITGKVRWVTFIGGGAIYFSLATAYGLVYVNPYGGKLHAFAASTGRYLWTADAIAGVGLGPAIAYGIVYLGTQDGKLFALTASTGKHLWTVTISNTTLYSPFVADGITYAASEDGKLFALAASTGKILWSAPAGGAASGPIVANGIVYIGSYDGTLYAFHLVDTPA